MSQRPSLNFWLLLVATLCVDAVAAFWVHSDPTSIERGPLGTYAALFATMFFFALVASQLSAVSIWAAFSPHHPAWKWSVILGALLLALGTIHWSMSGINHERDTMMADYAVWLGLHMTLLFGILWVLRRSKLWRNLTGAQSAVWQFSMLQLLTVMTVTAILLGFFVSSELFRYAWPGALVWVPGMLGDVAIALAVVIASQLPWHGFLRLAAMLASAIVTAALVALHPAYTQSIAAMCADALIQALLLAAWIEWGEIIPHASGDNDVAVPGATSQG